MYTFRLVARAATTPSSRKRKTKYHLISWLTMMNPLIAGRKGYASDHERWDFILD